MTITMSALPVLASIYGDKFGVRVKIEGTEAFTDGKVIHLPKMEVSEATRNAFMGYLTHEASHVRWTPFEEYKEKQRSFITKTQCLGDWMHSLLNILEDIRVDASMMASYPGASIDLDALEQLLLKSGYQTKVTGEESLGTLILHTLLFAGRRHLGFSGFDGAHANLEAALLKSSNQAMVSLVNRCANAVSDTTTPDELWAMTLEIADAYLQKLGKKRRRSSGNPAQQDSNQSPNDAQSQSSDSGSDSDDAPDNCVLAQSSAQQDSNQSTNDAQAQSSGSGSDSDDASDKRDLAQSIALAFTELDAGDSADDGKSSDGAAGQEDSEKDGQASNAAKGGSGNLAQSILEAFSELSTKGLKDMQATNRCESELDKGSMLTEIAMHDSLSDEMHVRPGSVADQTCLQSLINGWDGGRFDDREWTALVQTMSADLERLLRERVLSLSKNEKFRSIRCMALICALCSSSNSCLSGLR